MKRYNISVPKKYIKDGEEKTAWNRVGTLVKFEATNEKPEGYILELNMYPETKFGVFEDKPRNTESQESGYKEPVVQTEDRTTGDGMNVDDVPF